jgi:LAGLIDADG-like domain
VSHDEAAGYLSAMIDGEGAVYAAGHNRSIHIYNTDSGVIEACLEACGVLGIKARSAFREKPSKLSKHPLWTISFYGRENLERIASVLSLRSNRKREALSRALSSFTRRKPVTKEEFEDMIARGLTHREMKTELGYKSHSTVQYHLRRLGLTP